MSVMTESFNKVTEYRGISEYRLLSNGLKVLLAPRREAPVVAFMVVYLVGSRNEAVGHTGSTHLLEMDREERPKNECELAP